MRCEAVVLNEPGSAAVLESVEVLEPRDNEVMVRIVAASVCGSDRHALHNPSTEVPIVLGHEGGGVVERVGPAVSSVRVGDHVVIGPSTPCGSCYNCRTGLADLCDSPMRQRRRLGVMEDGHTRIRQGEREVHAFLGVGALAGYTVVREPQATVIDPDLPLELFCMAGCAVMTGLGAVFNIAEVRPGDTAAVAGCGGVGLNVVQGCRIAGATTVIAIDTDKAKLSIALEVGATHAIHLPVASLADAVLAIVARGVDTAFEVVGDPELVAECLGLTRVGGTCVAVGASPPGTVIPVRREDLRWQRRLVGCLIGGAIPVRDIPRIVSLYRDGRLNLEVLASEPLAPAEFASALSMPSNHARNVIRFSDP